jgi:hypothetical protein
LPVVSVTAASDALLSAKTMMSIAGALWAFFGLALFTIFKDVVLGRPAGHRVGAGRWVVRVVGGFFVVNFGAIAAAQSYGVWLIVKDAASLVKLLVLAGHVASLACYLFMAWAAFRGVQEAFEVRSGKSGGDRLVVMSAADLQRLRHGDRRVIRVEELTDEELELISKAEVPPEYAYLDAELDEPDG